MITLLGWLSALVALVTALAMLKDTYLTVHDRAQYRDIARRAWAALIDDCWHAIDRAEVSTLVRFVLRVSLLLLVVVTSGVCVLGGGLSSSAFEVGLRSALAAFLAMQAPCPWWRYIVFGERRHGSRKGVR